MLRISPKERPNLLAIIVAEWIHVAEEQIGLGEQGANNAGADVWKFTNPAGTATADRRRTRGAWCAAFLCWCLEEAVSRVSRRLAMGLRVPVKRTHSARTLGRRIGRVGVFVKPGDGLPRPGDVMVLRRGLPGQGHVGLVISAPDGNGDYRTIEANVGAFRKTQGRVAFKTRNVRDANTVGWARLLPYLPRRTL